MAKERVKQSTVKTTSAGAIEEDKRAGYGSKKLEGPNRPST